MNISSKINRYMMKSAAIFMAAGLFAVTTSGCTAKMTESTVTAKVTVTEDISDAESKSADVTTTENAVLENTVLENTVAEHTDERILFTDAAGREITLEKPAERVVSSYYITTSMLIALGAKDKTVGIEAKADKRPIYKMAAPDFLELPDVGTAKEFNLESCIALHPDLVILPKKLSEQADILNGMGITSMVVNPESMEELKQTIEHLGKATGAKERAEKLLSYYVEKTAMLKEIVANENENPKIYIAGTSSILRASSPKMYQNSLIELAGGVNAASELKDNGWADISYEQLLSFDPDIIVVIPEADYTKEDVLADSQLKNVNAVKNQKVYEMPSSFEAWDSPVTSGILGAMWLSSIVNEEKYPFEKFKKDASLFYKDFYDVDIDPDQITR